MAAMRSCTSACFVIGALVVAACGDGPQGPGTASGIIVVTASTGGAGRDSDGFRLSIDGSEPLLLEPNGKVILTGVAEGAHVIQLLGLAANCSVDGSNPRAVSVGAGVRSEITFSVVCVPELSSGFSILVSTTGTALDEDGYGLSVAGEALRHININAVEVFAGLAPGVRLVTLKDLAEGCSLVGGNPQPFTVVKDKIVEVRLQVVCGG
jgi:hypothetical protein